MIPALDRLVVVHWEDAWADACWHDTQEAHETSQEPVLPYSVGWVVWENDNGIALTSAIVKDGLGGLMFIPNGMIRKVTRLKEGEDA